MRELWTVHLGLVPYREAYALQECLRDARIAGAVPDTVLLLEHPPVYTRGRRSRPGELPLGEDWYAEHGIEIVDVPRGGKVTYHGPGQLVGYPILEVDDILGYVRALELAMINALHDEGLAGARNRPDEGREFIGAWVEDRKIGSIGIHRSHGVTTHGFAVNVDVDLTPFEWIVPCGLGDVRMSSLATELGRTGSSMPCFRKRMAFRLAEALGARQRLIPAARLHRELGALAVAR